MRVPFRIEGFYKVLRNLVGSSTLVEHLLEPYPDELDEPGLSPYHLDGGVSIGQSTRYATWLPNPSHRGGFIKL